MACNPQTDNGKLEENGKWGGHWIVACGYDDSSYHFVNRISKREAVSARGFIDAWKLWFIPNAEFDHAGVEIWR